MLAANVNEPATPLVPSGALKLPFLAAILVICCLSGACAGEPSYPVALMNWMLDGTFYALLVDKSEQRVGVWQIRDGEPSLVESFRCSTGENEGDKWIRGDMRTPEGVYFFCSVIDGKTLPPKYGPWAFTTDYPNFVDRRRGKNGDGIWLHGRDKPLAPKPDSNGCVALENQDLIRISRYIRLQSTPVIVVDKVIMAPRSVIMEREREIRNFIESWRQSWESKDLDRYVWHYSQNFQSNWMDLKGWKEKKRRLNKQYGSIKVKLGNIYLYKQDGLITAIFTQSYNSGSFQSAGIKVLYLTDHGEHRIYAEDYHQPVDEPFPVGPLLTRMGVESVNVAVERHDLRIRLVSTDDAGQLGENEAPEPALPSRGMVLETLPVHKTAGAVIALRSGERQTLDIKPKLITTLSMDEIVNEEDEIPITNTDRIAAALPENPRFEVIAEAENPDTERITQISFDKAAFKGTDRDIDPFDVKKVSSFLMKWKAAWEKKNLDAFMNMYHPNFEQGGLDYSAFRKSKRHAFRKYKTITVNIDQVEVVKLENGAEARFVQTFAGDAFNDKGRKTMVLDFSDGKELKILSENWSEYAQGDKKEQSEFDEAAPKAIKQNEEPFSAKNVTSFLAKWKSAWEQKDLDTFMKMYHPSFEQGPVKYAELRKAKRNFFRKYHTVRVNIDRVEVRKVENGAEVQFIQSFQGDTYRDKGRKTMVLDGNESQGFRIISENWASVKGLSGDPGS